MRGRTVAVTFLIMSLLISFGLSSYALPASSSLQEKADFLNTLKILEGTNGDYRLNEKLTRAEAATFAVRILGQYFHVLLNDSTYRKAAAVFPDVDTNLWYAPYVGYCAQAGILSGDTSGNYKPNDYITEKSFLKIILSILGYEINTDYTWNNIYKKAFEVGLVTDLSYISKEDDNTDFRRSGAVNIMYNALMLKEKKTGKELFYKLIDAEVITRAEAIKLGFIEDAVETDIEEIVVFDQQTVSIIFNEPIKDFDSILIYKSTDEDQELDYDIEDFEKNYITLKTKKQGPGVEYTIEIRGVEDTDGNVKEVLYGAFIGASPDEVESNFFRINKIEPVNEKSIKVYFTHPVNLNSENSIYYTIYDDDDDKFAEGSKDQLLVRTVVSENNCVLLTLKTGSFTADNVYTLVISGDMTSAYGVRLNDGKNDEMTFKAVGGESDYFRLEEVFAYDRETLLLSFNKEVNPFLAQQIYNFYLTDENNKPIKIEHISIESQGANTGKVLYLNIEGKFVKNAKYYITINNLNDITRQEYITEMTYSFEADYGSTDDFDIQDIDAIDRQTIEVYFTNIPDADSAEDESNYYVRPKKGTGKIYPVRALYEPSIHPYRVVLFFNDGDLSANREYELNVSYKFKDYLGNELGENIYDYFKASSVAKTAPSIVGAVPISTDAVKLDFDKEIAFNQNNLSPANYTLEYSYNNMTIKKVPLSVLYVNARTLVLKFDRLEYDITYTLKFTSIVDYTGASYKVTGEGKNFVEFRLEEEE
ncbi:S-layer protein [Thermoclostridium stercorarium subsp. leptospartum DSM 9219]|uniref:S-layer protein n=2 Tax=Thermoclostridium stercorarium TaxID=1510 RepID=A0A1B1YHG7_THEST|nr:S-layer homology domain-containing protein [Thermoclostridium stercorarium]ANX00218.1 S-layer protein [Thermoclostridium stercorarium subsp. leptospartum DSM 9219]